MERVVLAYTGNEDLKIFNPELNEEQVAMLESVDGFFINQYRPEMPEEESEEIDDLLNSISCAFFGKDQGFDCQHEEWDVDLSSSVVLKDGRSLVRQGRLFEIGFLL